jgi:hypothetical protein
MENRGLDKNVRPFWPHSNEPSSQKQDSAGGQGSKYLHYHGAILAPQNRGPQGDYFPSLAQDKPLRAIANGRAVNSLPNPCRTQLPEQFPTDHPTQRH